MLRLSVGEPTAARDSASLGVTFDPAAWTAEPVTVEEMLDLIGVTPMVGLPDAGMMETAATPPSVMPCRVNAEERPREPSGTRPAEIVSHLFAGAFAP